MWKNREIRWMQNHQTWTITIIAATMGGPSMTERSIPLIMSLMNIHIVCCKQNLEAN